MKRLWWLGLLLASFILGTAQAEVAVPSLKQRVTDLTSTLDVAQTQTLEAKLAAFEKSKGSQIAILMLPTTQPEVIEQFAIRVVEAWKLGRKGVDDGVLLLVAKEDRKLRIEVGYGLEGALNDATAKRIVAEIISPAFKQGDFYGGIDAGVTAIIKVIDGEALPPPAPKSGTHSFGEGSDSLDQLLGIGLLVFFIGNILLRQMLGRLPSGLVVGGIIGVIGWLMLLSLGAALVIGLIAFILSLMFGSNMGGGSGMPGGWGGGWGNSGGGGDSWSGGGGGGFGGGGASGDW